MTREEIFNQLDTMLADNKTKGFINHLVRSYIPSTNVEQVLATPNKGFTCALTQAKLVSGQELMAEVKGDEFDAKFFSTLKLMVDDKPSESKNPFIQLIGDRKIAVKGKETTTFLSNEAYTYFNEWVTTKALNGDKHINWLLGSIRHSSLMNRAGSINNEGVQAKVKKFEKKQNGTSASFALGDLPAFEKLRNLK